MLKGFDIGGLTIFVTYARQFSRPINEITMQINTIFSALAEVQSECLIYVIWKWKM